MVPSSFTFTNVKTHYHYVYLLSYKLWYSYLYIRRKQVKNHCITDPLFEDVNNAYERALVFMHKVFNEISTL